MNGQLISWLGQALECVEGVAEARPDLELDGARREVLNALTALVIEEQVEAERA